MVRAWGAYHAGGMGRGPLPYPGGWMDQPAWVEMVFAALDEENHKLEEARK